MSNQPILGATDGIMEQALRQLAQAKTLESAQERLLGSGNRTAVRPKSAEEAGIRCIDARVEVREENDLAFGGRCIEVAVYSLMKPGSFKRVLLDKHSPTAAIQIAAGACAEECCLYFNDPFDPSQAADLARSQFEKLRNS